MKSLNEAISSKVSNLRSWMSNDSVPDLLWVTLHFHSGSVSNRFLIHMHRWKAKFTVDQNLTWFKKICQGGTCTKLLFYNSHMFHFKLLMIMRSEVGFLEVSGKLVYVCLLAGCKLCINLKFFCSFFKYESFSLVYNS